MNLLQATIMYVNFNIATFNINFYLEFKVKNEYLINYLQ